MKATDRTRSCQKMAFLRVCGIALLFVISIAPCTQAQQNEFVLPQQKPESGTSTLTIPAMPKQQYQPPALNLPQTAPQAGQELEIPSRQLRSQAGYAQVTVTVTDQSGGYVTNLSKNDFRLYENGQQVPVSFFRRDLNTPVSIGILVDTSGSMQPKLSQARAAISQFLSDLDQHDDVFLFAFSDRPFLLQPFTTDHSVVRSRLALLHAFGRTALYDVILDGLFMVAHGRYDKKVLLVVTDGMDNSSTASLEQVVMQARRQKVLVYSIGIGDPNTSATSGFSFSFGPFGLGAGDLERVDAQTLRTLSRETGAKTFILAEVGDGEQLRRDTQAISNELRNQYTIGFLSPDPGVAGYRSLKVDVPGRPELDVRVRKGVEVGRRAESAGAGGFPPR